jgi:hypothetical protein
MVLLWCWDGTSSTRSCWGAQSDRVREEPSPLAHLDLRAGEAAFARGGYAALGPQATLLPAPTRPPLEEAILALHASLAGAGHYAGVQTIATTSQAGPSESQR